MWYQFAGFQPFWNLKTFSKYQFECSKNLLEKYSMYRIYFVLLEKDNMKFQRLCFGGFGIIGVFNHNQAPNIE